MKINYFILYPNNTYEFVEKEESTDGITYLKSIEDAVGDYCWFTPLKDYPGYFMTCNDCTADYTIEDYPGYFIARNDCTADYTKRNRLAESFTHEEEFDKCVLVKCYEGQACSDIEFETFSEDDRKYFELFLNEQIKVINNENR